MKTVVDLVTSLKNYFLGKDNDIYEVMGEVGAKNLLPFDLDEIKALNTSGTWTGNVFSYRGVDFTVNADGTISATGTATGGNASLKIFAASSNYNMLGKTVKLNGCPSGGSATTYRIQAYRMGSADGSTGTYFDDGEGTIAFEALNNASGTIGSFAVAVYEGTEVTNLLFKPMVRLASDTDDTYQPYAKTNQELTADSQVAADNDDAMLNVLGAKNLLPNIATSKVENGVTFVVNDNGSITVSTGSSGASAATQMDIGDSPIGTYHLSGCPSGGSVDTYSLYVAGQYLYETGNGLDINFTASRRVMIMIKSGTVITTPITFEPMIRPTSVADDTYVPYAMTNKALTDHLAIESLSFTLGTGVTNSNSRTRIFRIGDVVHAFIVAQYDTAITSQATAVPLLTINDSSARPLLQVFAPAHTSSTGCMGNLQINSGGNIQFSINDGTKTFAANSIVYGELVWIVGK